MAISFAEALKIVLTDITLLPKDNITLGKAVGRILREDVVAEINIPPFTNSAMDGFCVRYLDIENACDDKPVRLKVIEDLPAGSSTDTVIGVNQAIRIMTGAPIPLGGDVVVRLEDVEEDDGNVIIRSAPAIGDNIRKAGEDIPVGSVVLKDGKKIVPADLGLLASLGRRYIRVSESPRVALLATGDELISIDEPLSRGKIRSSNSYCLMGLIDQYGGKAWNLGKADDDKNRIKEKLFGAKHADIILTIGGISVGRYDVVKTAFSELGVEEKFWKVKLKPGKPLFYGTWEGKPVFGLPGNPVSSMICFEQFVLPMINKMMGYENKGLPVVRARLMNDLEKRAELRTFFRARLVYRDGGFEAYGLVKQGSGMLTTMSHSNSIIIGPEGVASLKEGEMVDVQIRNHHETY